VQNPPPPGGLPPPPPPPPPPGGYPAPPPPAYPVQPAYGYAPQVGYGGFWIRFVALIVDSLIIAVPLVILGLILGVATGVAIGVSGNSSDQTTTTAGTAVIAFLRLIAFVVSVGYFVYFWGGGSTPGMRLFHLRVVDANTGVPIGYGRAALRYLGYVISAVVCYIGLIWAAFDGRKQGWHDKIANTVVLQG
jgi:uncharacterized RDD family membrane protein YckC